MPNTSLNRKRRPKQRFLTKNGDFRPSGGGIFEKKIFFEKFRKKLVIEHLLQFGQKTPLEQ